MLKIYLVIDVIGWVQHKRAKEFIKLNDQKKFKYKIINYSTFISRIEKFIKEKCLIYIFSWRNLDNDMKLIPDQIKNKMIVGITSHYNVGGIKKLSKCMTKNMSFQQRKKKTYNLLNNFKYVSVNSKILQKFLSPKLKSKIFLLENGINHNFFKIPKKIQNSEIVIGWNGKNKNAKNYELLNKIKNFYSKNKNLKFKYLIADRKVSFFNKIKQKLVKDNIVKNFYNKIDYYICVSWHEGTPNPCLEALSCGIPVITTKVGNMPEVIKSSRNGFFVEPNLNSINKILSKIQNIKKYEYKEMSKYSRKKIIQEWTWEKKYKNIENMFLKIIKIEF